MVPEAPPAETEHGLQPTGEPGWYVLNAREAVWRRSGIGMWPRLEGARPVFEQLGVGVTVLQPGEPMTKYDWETDQEDFLILSARPTRSSKGRAAAPAVGLSQPAGDEPRDRRGGRRPVHRLCGGLAGEPHVQELTAPRRPRQLGRVHVDEAALRHGACVEEETSKGAIAYARFGEVETLRYREGLLPDL